MFRKLWWCALGLSLCACKAQIQHGLDERQANELQTVLVERGLDAAKVVEPGKKPTWAIEVDADHATDAVRILAEMGLPRPRSEGFNDVFGKGSLIPSPTEERALYLEALSGEIARTLESVEGVTAARVHLVLPPPARPGMPQTPAKASAFLKVRPGAQEQVAKSREELRALVAGSVEGLTPDAVTLVINEVTSTVPAPTPGPSAAARLRVLVIALGLVVTILAIAMVVLTFRIRALRTKPVAVAAPSTTPSATRPVVSATRKVA